MLLFFFFEYLYTYLSITNITIYMFQLVMLLFICLWIEVNLVLFIDFIAKNSLCLKTLEREHDNIIPRLLKSFLRSIE